MFSISGKYIVGAHTICATSAFLCALIVGYSLHFEKIVSNSYYSYPDEWFPSVSATVGDRYPERFIFQFLIALTSFPRFMLLALYWIKTGSVWGVAAGTLRTIACGGWIYITSTDDHNMHDLFMISYIVLTIPWDIFVVLHAVWKKQLRLMIASSFFFVLIPLIYWFIQHKVHHRSGAYSIYAYFEWFLIILDIAFDGMSYYDMSELNITIGNGNISQTENPDQSSGLDSGLKDRSTLKDLDNDYSDSCLSEVVDKSMGFDIVVEEEEYIYAPIHSVVKQDSLLYIAVNIFDSFMFWTNLTALLCMLWYFPLWRLGITGFEIVIVAVLSPIMLYLPLVPVLVHQYGPLLANFIGIGAFLIKKPETRLITVAIATAISTMNFVYTLKSICKDTVMIVQYATTWILGLVASVILKMGFYSNNPIWPITNESNHIWNRTGLAVAISMALLTPYTNSCHYGYNIPFEQSTKPKIKVNISIKSKLRSSFGFGALMFSIHQLLTDSSTLIYWCLEGWSNNTTKGPNPRSFGPLVCVVMAFGAISSWRFCHFTNNGITLTLLLSTIVICSTKITGWYKFIIGGLPYITCILYYIPNYFVNMNNIGYGGFMLSFLLYVILVLAHVWTVAYAFVPYGWVLRERLNYILLFSTSLVCYGSTAFRSIVRVNSGFMYHLFFVLFIFISAIGYFTHQLKPTGIPHPYHPDSRLFTAGIWTIHFGLDNDMWTSETRIIELIRDMELDVVGLLETDTQRITMGNRDLTAHLAHELQMYADYGPGPNKHTWGCILLSKFPIIQSEHHLLPSPVGEIAPAIHAVLDIYGEYVDVYVFHSGQEEDELDRKLQSEAMCKLMASNNRPAILLSYLVTEPHIGNYHNYVNEESGMKDIDPNDSDRWCQYILFKNLKRTGYARVSRGSVTDTELQVGKFQIDNNTNTDLIRIAKDDVNEDIRFPDKFLGDGKNGHRYHVFSEPRYYGQN